VGIFLVNTDSNRYVLKLLKMLEICTLRKNAE
jgi:hypothetical protein